MTRHVVVLAGGLSHEREVSLRSGSRLHEALRELGIEVTLRDTDADLIPWLAKTKPDAAIITLHGSRGENGAIQGILEMVGIPYLGTPSKNCRLAWEKNIAKNLVRARRIHHPAVDVAVAQHVPRSRRAGDDRACWSDYLGLPLMVKPQHGGSALGATAVRSAEELPAALVGAFAYGDIVVVETVRRRHGAGDHRDRGGGRRSRAARGRDRRPTSGFFDYESRYTAGLTTYFTPARLDRRGGRRGGGSRHRRPPGAGPARRVPDGRDRAPPTASCTSSR